MTETPAPAYDQIEHLGGLRHVRERPGMYVGSTADNGYNAALMNTVREVVGNSADEFLNGYATTITVTLDPWQNTLTVADDGRGIPYGPTTYTDPVTKVQTPIDKLHLATGVLATGAKFNKGTAQSFHFALGLNGVGLKAVAALSQTAAILVQRGDGQEALIKYAAGILVEPGVTTQRAGKAGSGTTVQWVPDAKILPFQFDPDHLRRYLHEQAYLNAGLTLTFQRLGDPLETFHEPKGIAALADTLTGTTPVLGAFAPVAGTQAEGTAAQFELILRVTATNQETIAAFVNGAAIETASAPVAAVRQAYARTLTNAWKDYPKTKRLEKIDLRPEDCRSGLILVLKLLHADPAFDSQTKTKLISTDIATTIQQQLPNLLQAQLLADPTLLDRLLQHALRQATARLEAEKARKRILGSGASEAGPTLSLGIFTPPLRPDPATNDLYLTEGESAAGTLITAAKARDPATGRLYKENIGILALRGNILNTLEKTLAQAQQNTEIATLIRVSGLNPKDPEDLSGLRFRRFLIATDMDTGGDHISILIISFFLAHFPAVLAAGRVARVLTPFFEIQDRQTKALHFIYPPETREEGVQRCGYATKDVGRTYDLRRIKGLGELSIKGGLTLVAQPKLQAYAPKDLTQMRQLFQVFSGEGYIPQRRALIFALGLDPAV